VTSVVNDLKEVRDGEDTIASTRDARAPRNAQIIPNPKNFRLPIETHSLPSLLAASHRGFTFCLANPVGSAADFEQILTTENTEHAEARTIVASLTSLRPL
jgi:hypothetical protein